MEATLHSSGPSADEALARLIAGNERFLRGQTHWGGVPRETLVDLAKGQRPFATILGCSDSRVPPEWIFDAGMGELFVVRVAGNVFSPEIAGSLQYAGTHLQTPLFVVLGHEGCGAVSAAMATKFEGAQQLSRIQTLVDSIAPALPEFDAGLSPEERLTQAIESNVRWTVRQILNTPEGQARVAGRTRDSESSGAIYMRSRIGPSGDSCVDILLLNAESSNLSEHRGSGDSPVCEHSGRGDHPDSRTSRTVASIEALL